MQAVEVRPGNRSVVHHVLVQYMAKPDMTRTPVLKFNTGLAAAAAAGPRGAQRRSASRACRHAWSRTYAPGTNPQVFRAGDGAAPRTGRRPRAPDALHAERQADDRSHEGRARSSRRIRRRAKCGRARSSTRRFTLPAGSPDTSVPGEVEFQQDTIVYGLFPHTHLRGKAWDYKLVLPDGTTKTILSVPRYDFNWQTYYLFKEPLQVPKGAKILSTAWYDNSPGNKDNPELEGGREVGRSDVGGNAVHGHSSSARWSPPKPITDDAARRRTAVTSTRQQAKGRRHRRGRPRGRRRPAAPARVLRAAGGARSHHHEDHVRARDPRDPLRALHRLPRPGRFGADGAHDLRGSPAVGARDQGAGAGAADAEVARRARLRRLQERSLADADRDRRCSCRGSTEACPSPPRPRVSPATLPPLRSSALSTAVASAFRRKIGVPAVRVAAGAADGVARVPARWVSGWSFEPGDPLITSATFSLADGTVVGTWVAGDEAVTLPSNSAIRITSSVARQPAAPAAGGLRGAVQGAGVGVAPGHARGPRRPCAACGPNRRAAERPGRDGTPRSWPSARCSRPAEAPGCRLERAGAPKTIVGWFRDFDPALPAHLLARAAGGHADRSAAAGAMPKCEAAADPDFGALAAHSYRSTASGSSRAAFRAGKKHAATATTISNVTMNSSVTGSVALV